MIIRDEQIAVLNKYVENKFKEDVIAYLLDRYPEQGAILGPDGLKELVDSGLRRAKKYGIKIKRDAADFLGILVTNGKDFEILQSNRWASEILENPNLAGGTKILQLETQLDTRKELKT